MKHLKKMLALVLAVCLCIGILPGSVMAATDTTEYLFLATDRHTNTSIIGTMIDNMESDIGENKLDYLGLGGDMVGSGNSHPEYDSSTVLSEVTSATSSLSAKNVDIVAGIHDMNVNDDAGIVLDYENEDGGAQIYEGDQYYVYGVPESCISGAVDGIDPETEANDFVTWANSASIDKSKVIIVLSHYPLHKRRNDNLGASYWVDAMNTVATGGDTTIERDIAFFWGHNHTSESSTDTAVYHVAPNNTLSVQGTSESASLSKTIYFTYANAGYLNSHSSATLVTITDKAITFDKYENSSISTTNTVTRAVTTTLESISVSGTVEYNVGDDLELVVTATYSDGTTKDVTSSTEFTGYDMNTAGTYTVTATYEGKIATFDITVNPTINTVSAETTYKNDDGTYTNQGNDVIATGLGLTGVSAVFNEVVLSDTYGEAATDYYAYDVALSGYAGGNVEIEFNAYNVDLTGAIVNLVNADGSVTKLSGIVTYETTEDGVSYTNVSFAVPESAIIDGKFTVSFGVQEIIIPEGYTLSDLAITGNPIVTKYFVDEDFVLGNSGENIPLDITGLEVTATYTNGTDSIDKVLLWNSFDTQKDAYALNFDMSNIGTQDVEISYTYEGVQKTISYKIIICYEGYTDTASDVNVVFKTPEVTDVVITKNVADESVSSVLENLLANYVSYDFEFEGYTEGNAVTVTLPVSADVEKVGVFHVSDEGKATRVKNVTVNADGTVTFVATAFSKYVVGEDIEIEVPEPETATGSGTTTTTTKKTVYVLTNSISSGNSYLIANSNSASDTTRYLLANNNGSVAATGVTIKSDDEIGIYIELDDATDELWTVSGSQTTTLKNGNYYLTTSGNYRISLSSSSKEWSWASNNNRLSVVPGQYTTYYLRYSNGWGLSSSYNSVYFYSPTEIDVETTDTVAGTYSVAGTDISVAVSSGITANLTSTLNFVPNSGDVTTEDVSTTATYEVVTVDASGNTVDGDPKDIISKIENGVVTFTGNYGSALVKVSYTTAFGTVTDYITIEAKAPYYSIQLHKAELTEVSVTEFTDGVTYYTFDSTTNTYKVAATYVEGTTYYTTPVIQGEEITDTIALKGIEKGDTYSVWAVVKEHNSEYPDGDDMGALGNALTWTVSDTSIATIDTTTGVITFTGANYGTFTVTVSYEGADGKVVTDTITISVTDSLYIVPGDGTDDFPEYPDEGSVRFDKTASAVGNFSETGIALVELSMTGVPYTEDNAMDVVVMLDMTGSMSDDGMEAAEEATKSFVETIVKNEDGTYNSNRVAVYAFNSGESSPYELVELTAISSDTELETANTAIDTASDKRVSGGTPYEEATKQCYDVLQAAKTKLPEEETTYNRQQFCVFMSDGGPTTYYGSDDKTYYGGNNTSGDVTIASMMTNYTSTTASNWSMDLPTEYYTDLMKADGVTIYTVGLLLQNVPSNPAPWNAMNGVNSVYDSTTDSLTTVGTHYYFTSEILKQMATDTSKYIDIFDVNNADNATAKFTAIAQSILEAAKDIVVEDKIGNNYSINFSVPGYGTDNAVPEDALDGTTEFYIQAVEYQLNDDKERTGDPTVLENFTFNADGTLKSHTVDGVACADCAHVTTTDGVITAIDGTYFDYKSDSTGEYLTWNADKLTTTELALQYFAHLDDSSGVAAADQVDPGTYYTNEYATLTYTNYNGNQVQQEFPVPQMTWYGAQVSYVFYLVNDAGQPVNRAGRVVPFAEAVYVTDVNTFAIVWNDLEQSAGLEAERLAGDLVPDVYDLYDDDASYNIHVYADEEGTNLNNHFVIGGDVTDDYNKTTNSWTNAQTTYVFNTKADAVKYNTVGAYIANDGSDTTTSNSYYCKSAYLENATYTTSVDDAGVTTYEVTSVGDGYQKVDGETQVLASNLESTTGGTVIDGYVYYVDENGVYTIVQKTDGKEVRAGFDFANTTVAFAVVWKPELVPDTVVVDYGLDVVIDVTTNDAMAAGVTGVMLDAPDVETGGAYDTAVGVESVNDGDGLWTASVENLTSVRFHQNEMGMNEPETFYYEAGVNYYESGATSITTTNMYSSVTVIPATTIYYEDSFVDYKVYTKESGSWALDEDATWSTDGTTVNAVQDIDRPGMNKISEAYDADNVYGYDSAYDKSSEYSLGSARYVAVNETTYGTAQFTFYGTGFDIVSMTSNNTGTITVKVYAGAEASGASVKNVAVDTYYGYTKDDEGNWVVDSSASNALYQIPVITVENLTYGQYTVVVKCAYNTALDHQADGSYNFYMDAVRIYDPTGVVSGSAENNTDSIVSDAYSADGESYPVYEELRDNVIATSDFTTGTMNGLVFIDGDDQVSSISDYANYGPNNELYLESGQAIVFSLDLAGYINSEGNSIVESVQLGMKSADGENVKYIVGDAQSIENKSDLTGAATTTISTATDMYYDMTSLKDNVIVIYNAGTSGTLSLTNIKVTFVEKPSAVSGLFYVDYDVVEAIIENVNTEEFTPTVEIVANSVEAGKNIDVTITTSTDVAAISVNGSMLTTYAVNTEDSRVWTTEVATSESTEDTELTIEVVAYSEKGTAYKEDAVIVDVSATKDDTSIENTIVSIINEFVSKLKNWFNW